MIVAQQPTGGSIAWPEHVPAIQILESPLGPIALAATPAGLLAVEIGIGDLDAWREMVDRWMTQNRSARTTRRMHSPVLVVMARGPGATDMCRKAAVQLDEYFAGERQTFDLPLDRSLFSSFQIKVLPRVQAIPYGQTRTYGDLARQIRRPAAARAVGQANARNPLAIVVPCHRLVGADGSLRGYGAPGGIRVKAWLLEHEQDHL